MQGCDLQPGRLQLSLLYAATMVLRDLPLGRLPQRDDAAGGGEGLTLDRGGCCSVSRAGDNKWRTTSAF